MIADDGQVVAAHAYIKESFYADATLDAVACVWATMVIPRSASFAAQWQALVGAYVTDRGWGRLVEAADTRSKP